MNKIDTDDEMNFLLGTSARFGERRQGLKRGIWIIAMITVAAIVLFWLRSTPNGQSASYITQAVERGDFSVSVTATGATEPRKEVSVGIEVSGTISEVFADFNDPVAEGQVLARLDTTILSAQLEQSRASLQLSEAAYREAIATLRQSDRELARLLDLQRTSGGVLPSSKDLDSATATRDRAAASLESARAQVRQAQAQLAVKQTELSKAEIISPINGVVLSRKIDPGQTVAATFQTPELFILAEDLAEMQLSIEVDEADVGRVREGQAAVFSVDAYPDREFPAEITTLRFAPISNAGVVTYEAILSVDNSDMRLRPGMTATALITVEEVKDALIIPNAALRFAPRIPEGDTESSIMSALVPRPLGPNAPANPEFTGRKRTVWSLDANGRPQGLEVLIGTSDGNATEIVAGDIKPGDRLIIEQSDAP